MHRVTMYICCSVHGIFVIVLKKYLIWQESKKKGRKHPDGPWLSSLWCYENTVLRWFASPTFSKNMKSMRKQAPISTAFILTSKSIGNWIPKLSVSVKTSFKRPLHCLLIRPMVFSPSFPFNSKFTSPQQLQAKHGPSSLSRVSLLGPWMENFGRQGCQSCLT